MLNLKQINKIKKLCFASDNLESFKKSIEIYKKLKKEASNTKFLKIKKKYLFTN